MKLGRSEEARGEVSGPNTRESRQSICKRQAVNLAVPFCIHSWRGLSFPVFIGHEVFSELGSCLSEV